MTRALDGRLKPRLCSRAAQNTRGGEQPHQTKQQLLDTSRGYQAERDYERATTYPCRTSSAADVCCAGDGAHTKPPPTCHPAAEKHTKDGTSYGTIGLRPFQHSGASLEAEGQWNMPFPVANVALTRNRKRQTITPLEAVPVDLLEARPKHIKIHYVVAKKRSLSHKIGGGHKRRNSKGIQDYKQKVSTSCMRRHVMLSLIHI